jgi:protein Mpv17
MSSIFASFGTRFSFTGIVRTAWRAYSRALLNRPILTRAVTSGTIMTSADLLCQKIEGTKQIDVRRAASMGVTGLCLAGPAVHGWYTFLGRVVGERGFKVVATKLALDQIVFLPIMFGSIMTTANLLNGKTIEQNKQVLDKELFGAIKRGWCVWSVATGLNFAVCPPQYRVLFNNTVSLGWNVYLSNVNNRGAAAIVQSDKNTNRLQPVMSRQTQPLAM